jgi:hypothetical protein
LPRRAFLIQALPNLRGKQRVFVKIPENCNCLPFTMAPTLYGAAFAPAASEEFQDSVRQQRLTAATAFGVDDGHDREYTGRDHVLRDRFGNQR